jgi:hypothetical protein
MREQAESALPRELQHRGLLVDGGSFSADLLVWMEAAVDPNPPRS